MIDYIYKHYDSVASTNDLAKQLINDDCPEGTVLYTDEQTDGKGRSGRVWTSGKCDSIATSLVLYPTLPEDAISCITLVAALSVRSAIKRFCGLDCQIKWPNDIVYSNKKICGILTERIFIDGKSAVIVGIGVNVRNEHFPEELEDKATSILKEVLSEKEEMHNILKGDNDEAYNDDVVYVLKEGDNTALLHLIWDRFNEYYDIFVKTGNMASLVERYNSHLINVGRVVKADDVMGPIKGVALGINDNGELAISTGKGKMYISAGEVSVRGLYGYV
ncbi:MAG: biotin--[acetyl-CoA-carboxylase] ligase [Lachnospiraceae bacterium]|nr:biotin--[acetyl-CoA-carboxylase] ligase [Lachnospiraceae bacterium]